MAHNLTFSRWDASDTLDAEQFNIICSNILSVSQMLSQYTIVPLPSNISNNYNISDVFSADILNGIESWLKTATAAEGINYAPVIFVAGKTPITYIDVNRWEKTAEQLYNMALKNKDKCYICGTFNCGG